MNLKFHVCYITLRIKSKTILRQVFSSQILSCIENFEENMDLSHIYLAVLPTFSELENQKTIVLMRTFRRQSQADFEVEKKIPQKTIPKGFSASKCDVRNWIFSKSFMCNGNFPTRYGLKLTIATQKADEVNKAKTPSTFIFSHLHPSKNQYGDYS